MPCKSMFGASLWLHVPASGFPRAVSRAVSLQFPGKLFRVYDLGFRFRVQGSMPGQLHHPMHVQLLVRCMCHPSEYCAHTWHIAQAEAVGRMQG